MSGPDVGVWRVVDTSGVVHAVTVHPRRPDWIASVDGPGYRATLGAEDEWGFSPRGAVLLLAAARRVEAVEIVAPGEMTRAEALAWIAAEPARVAAAVAGETARCIAACECVASQCREGDERDLALTCAEAIAVDAPAQGGG